jgi:hypothetical protein
LCSGWNHLGERSLNGTRISRADEARDLAAVLEENESRPELDAEGAPKPLSARVGDADVANLIVLRKRAGDERLRAAAMAAPRITELEHGRAGKPVDVAARRRAFRILANEAHPNSCPQSFQLQQG